MGLGGLAWRGVPITKRHWFLGDTTLLLRTLLVFAICAPVEPMLGSEHPADPASWVSPGSTLAQGPSIWQFPEMQRFMKAVDVWEAGPQVCF